jgi:hypothetical protein
MRGRGLWLGLLLALGPGAALAQPAQVGTWARACQPGSIANSVQGGSWVCYTPAAGASVESASPILDLSGCENVDLFMWDDFDGDATVCTVSWDIESCPPGANALTTDALKNAACNTLPGTAALSGDDVESNLAALFLRVHGLAAGANIDSCRIAVKCAEGSQ